MHCDVVIVGYRLNAKEPAPKALERILGLFAEDARKLARTFPATVLSAGSQEQAERLMEQLTEAGALVELRASKPMPAPPPREAQPTTRTRNSLPNQRQSLPSTGTDKISLDLAPLPRPRTQQRSEQHKAAPPPPPAAALYQLGDFGLAAGGASTQPSAPLHVPSPPGGFALGAPSPNAPRTAAARRASITGNMDLDLDSSAGMALELDQPLDTLSRGAGSRASSSRTASQPHEDLHSLGERFSDSPAPLRGPAVDERAFRSVQRAPRNPDSRRPGARPATKGTSLSRTLRELVPATILFALLSGGSLVAVGYALDPEDPLAGLTREHAALAVPEADDTQKRPDAESNLHPLLRATPAATRAPLAAILRSRIAGVHDVAVHSPSNQELHCAVVERVEGETETRLAQVRETGHEVAVSPEISAQLHEHERTLRSELKRPELTFAQVCLSL